MYNQTDLTTLHEVNVHSPYNVLKWSWDVLIATKSGAGSHIQTRIEHIEN